MVLRAALQQRWVITPQADIQKPFKNHTVSQKTKGSCVYCLSMAWIVFPGGNLLDTLNRGVHLNIQHTCTVGKLAWGKVALIP